jgi:hypothetical protein
LMAIKRPRANAKPAREIRIAVLLFEASAAFSMYPRDVLKLASPEFNRRLGTRL